MINASLGLQISYLIFFIKVDIKPSSLLKEANNYLCLFELIMGIQSITLQFEKY